VVPAVLVVVRALHLDHCLHPGVDQAHEQVLAGLEPRDRQLRVRRHARRLEHRRVGALRNGLQAEDGVELLDAAAAELRDLREGVELAADALHEEGVTAVDLGLVRVELPVVRFTLFTQLGDELVERRVAVLHAGAGTDRRVEGLGFAVVERLDHLDVVVPAVVVVVVGLRGTHPAEHSQRRSRSDDQASAPVATHDASCPVGNVTRVTPRAGRS
jgi:hypothetical protein